LKDGVTPLTLENIPKGAHTIRLKKGKYSGETAVKLKPNEIKRIQINMKLQDTKITFKSEPIDAMIILNNKFTGNYTPLITKDIEIGKYDFRLAKLGYKDIQKQIDIIPNENNLFDFSLEKVDFSPNDLKLEKKRINRYRGRYEAKKYYWISGIFFALSASGIIATHIIKSSVLDESYESYKKEKDINEVIRSREDVEYWQTFKKIVEYSSLGTGILGGLSIGVILVKSF